DMGCGSSCSSCGHSHGCSSCDSCSSCSSCGGGCGGCDECDLCCGCDHGVKDLFWPVNCSCFSTLKNCCHETETFNGCGKGGCGEQYWCDWKSNPPCPDPCDKCTGCYNGGCPCEHPCYTAGPRFGSVPWPSWPPHDGPGVYQNDDYVGQKSK